jgi:hypothetical protein
MDAIAAVGYIDVTIAAGANESDVFDCRGLVPVALQMPAAWTAASVDFLASADGTTFALLVDSTGTRASATVAVDRTVALDGIPMAALLNGKLHSCNATGVSVAQDAARVIRVIVRGI